MTDTTATDTTSTDNTPNAADVVNNRKKPHTSPRVIMGAEVQTCIAALRTAWEKEGDCEGKEVALALLANLSSSVETLTTGGHPKDANGQKRTGPVNPLAGKRHYVALTQDGTFAYLDTDGKIPCRANLPQCTTVWGPFRTDDGARYRVAHPESLSDMVPVFAPAPLA